MRRRLCRQLKPELLKRVSAQALEKGRQEGRREEKIEIAKTMLLKGLNIEIVVGLTELSKKEIKKLLT